MAYSLYNNHDWANPYAIRPTGPTAHEAPLFPALLASIYKVFGGGGAGVLVAESLEALVLAVQTLLMIVVALSFGEDFEVGCVAAIFLILGSDQQPYWEQNYVGLLLVIASLLAFKLLKPTDMVVERRGGTSYLRSPMAQAWVLGALWGTILLMSPSPSLVWLSWVFLLAWKMQGVAKRAWVPVLLIPVLMLIPWTWRNYRVFQSPVLIRGNLGLELDVSNNSCASYALRENIISGCFRSQHPNSNSAEADKVIQLGEANYNRGKLREALHWIAANPVRFVRLTLQRFVYFWFPSDSGSFFDALFGFYHDEGPIQAWVVYPTTLFSMMGFVLLWRRQKSAALICGSILLFAPLVYYLVEFEYRYRLPVLWVTFFLGAVAVRRGVNYAKSRLSAPLLRWPRQAALAQSQWERAKVTCLDPPDRH